MEEKLTKVNQRLIALLILAQPIITMIQANIVRDIQILGFSLFEFFNIFLATISCIISIYTYKNKRNFVKYIPYILLLTIYLILHGIHIYGFNYHVYELQEPNFLVECYYIIRTFIVPLLLVFDIYYSQITKEQLLKIFSVFMYIITTVIVLANLFHVALVTYAPDTVRNSYDILDWFTFKSTGTYSYYELTSMGWFLSGNQMSSILFMTYPLTVYIAYSKRTWIQYVLVLLQGLSLLMLGTKTANIGCLLVLITFCILWLLFRILKHPSHGIIVLLLITVIITAIFPFSPIGHKNKYQTHTSTGKPSNSSSSMLEDVASVEDNANSTIDIEMLKKDSEIFKSLDYQSLSKDEQFFVRNYMKKYSDWFGIAPFILEHYDDLSHSNFWTYYMQTTPNNDYRILKTMILKDIYNNNNRPTDKYLGLGYTLNYIYTESDYSYQFYSYGILGILVLIAPYFFALLFVIYKGLTNFKRFFNLETAMYALCPILGLTAARFSGHVLERVFPLIMIAFTLGLLLVHVRSNLQQSSETTETN